MKLCTKCSNWKEESKFGKNSSQRDGLDSWCGECCREQSRRRYRKNGKRVKRYYTYEESHRVVDGVKEKCCRSCRKWKPLSQFYKGRRNKDGLAEYCKKCADKATLMSRKRRLAVRN